MSTQSRRWKLVLRFAASAALQVESFHGVELREALPDQQMEC